MSRKRILVLFAQEWDQLALDDPEIARRYEFIHRGFDLFRFPENARLLFFNVHAFIDRMVRLGRKHKVDAVLSPHEQFGALIAAVVAERLGLPGTDPRAILIAQNKFYARRAIDTIEPQANPAYGAFRYTFSGPRDIPLGYPLFVKPVKAAFSVLARQVSDFGELRRHLSFRPFEKYIIKSLVRPYNRLLAEYCPDQPIDGHWLVAEGLLDGLQINIDGFADRGEFRIIGIIDEIMYPGTIAFNRFEFPTSLPAPVRARAEDLAIRAMRAVGFDHGMFNVELTYSPATDSLKIIEINPRVASQFMTLYEWVLGIRLFDVMLDLALGRTPRFDPRPQEMSHAASFIFRVFDANEDYPVPGRRQLQALRRDFPDARLMLYGKQGTDLAREMKWMGSHRYAILNLGGRDRTDLYNRYRTIRDRLGFSASAGPEPRPMWPGETEGVGVVGEANSLR